MLAWVLATGTANAAAPSTNLESYSVVGEINVLIGAQAVVQSGHVALNQPNGIRIELGNSARIEDGWSISGTTVRLDDLCSPADVITNDLVSVPSATIRGSLSPLPFAPILTLPPLPTFVPGRTNVDVPAGQQLVLGPGHYRNVRVRTGGTLLLTGGGYDFDRVKLYVGAAVRAAARSKSAHSADFSPQRSASSVRRPARESVPIRYGSRRPP
jgi:hypothetical protein